MTRCPLCQSSMQLRERRWDLTSTWRVYRCPECEREWTDHDDGEQQDVDAVAHVQTGGVDPRAPDDEHVQNVEDGAGCTEIWEHLSGENDRE